jgi:hypothetical protein
MGLIIWNFGKELSWNFGKELSWNFERESMATIGISTTGISTTGIILLKQYYSTITVFFY